MAMTPSDAEAVGTLIATKVTTFTAAQKLDPDFMWKEIMKIIYANLITDAVVATTVAGTLPPGPVAASGSGGIS